VNKKAAEKAEGQSLGFEDTQETGFDDDPR
jgi:hypothetical protein